MIILSFVEQFSGRGFRRGQSRGKRRNVSCEEHRSVRGKMGTMGKQRRTSKTEGKGITFGEILKIKMCFDEESRRQGRGDGDGKETQRMGIRQNETMCRLWGSVA